MTSEDSRDNRSKKPNDDEGLRDVQKLLEARTSPGGPEEAEVEK